MPPGGPAVPVLLPPAEVPGEPGRRGALCGPKLERQPRSNRTVRGESPRRGGGPPLSVGSVGRAERLLPGLQARGPSPRTKGSGEL